MATDYVQAIARSRNIRGALRNAVRLVADEGIVVTVQGAGTYVSR